MAFAEVCKNWETTRHCCLCEEYLSLQEWEQANHPGAYFSETSTGRRFCHPMHLECGQEYWSTGRAEARLSNTPIVDVDYIPGGYYE